MVLSRSLTIAPSYDDLTLDGAELEEIKGLRILRVPLDSKLTPKTHLRFCRGLCQRQPEVCWSCMKQESYLIVRMCPRAVSMHILCLGTEGRLVPCVCSIRFIIEWTTL